MSYSVTLLLSNGRRQRVPVKLNTPLLMILEEACKKHKLNPDEYELKFHNRILDLTSTIQFCGITNNAQLELIPATKPRTETPITVFLQLENGERLSGSFLPSRTLWDIINELCSEDVIAKQNLVIIYTRQEVYGEKLRSTSLKMFGLTSGSALLRLIHRTEDQLKNQCVSSVYRLPPKPKQIDQKPVPIPAKAEVKTEEESKLVPPESSMHVDDSPKIMADTNIEPSDKRMDVDEQCLMELKAEKKEDDFRIETEKTNLIPDEVPSDSLSTPDTVNEIRQNFNINEVEYIGERYALLFHIDSAQSPRFNDPAAEDDDFYELTIEDAKTLLRDIKRTRSELEEANLETSAAKDRKKFILLERTLSIYPHCVVRILFPNRIVLQGVFKSTETILEVINFTKSFVKSSILDFYLYTSPPKIILKVNETLLDIGAIPGINLYFGGDLVEHNSTDSFVKQQYLDKMVSPTVALQVANHFRRTSSLKGREFTEITPVPTVNNETKTISTSVHPPSTTVQRETPKKPDSGKVPKWFKLQ